MRFDCPKRRQVAGEVNRSLSGQKHHILSCRVNPEIIG
ncbi:hypothetical protein TFKS16_0957 [Tannerella forsythia KS16]|uniref:Uncharacterized protein n=1 Tax=Tannerella forsythia (strain ATCC 43037 / JCM 10827 / CCUG 21028 A / KCTC 5666 / FDC 338) TaxID=203275 RepID=G8UJR3_TANFA|nr:hypothetical protein BFO_1282 [Tannerella forsythia 92A2]BAR51240.1 hypothetical protein TFKS16_0957 [Tannerella forsythia KS16]